MEEARGRLQRYTVTAPTPFVTFTQWSAIPVLRCRHQRVLCRRPSGRVRIPSSRRRLGSSNDDAQTGYYRKSPGKAVEATFTLQSPPASYRRPVIDTSRLVDRSPNSVQITETAWASCRGASTGRFRSPAADTGGRSSYQADISDRSRARPR
jgi:hypothetical protein